MKKRENRIIVGLIIIIAILVLFGGIAVYSISFKKPTRSGVLINNEEEEKPRSKYTLIKGFSEMYFKSGETVQEFDFVNPASNRCYMDIKLIMPDGQILFEVDRIEPGYCINKVILNKSLDRGKYSGCKFVIECYSMQDDAQLNGATMSIDLYVR